MSQTRTRYQNWAIPFHLPSNTVVESKHRSVMSIIFNYKKWMKVFASNPRDHDFCNCAQTLKANPRLSTTAGHIASPANLLSINSLQNDMLSHSANNMVFPAQAMYLQATVQSIKCWISHHQLPSSIAEDWIAFVFQEWPKHLLESHRFYT